MANPQLTNALKALQSAKASGLPATSSVEAATDYTTWSGTKTNGDPWSLIKNHDTSYNVIC